ncbi:hypothetical protein CXF86_14990 [Shewanella sp. GutCb]|uniref:hypothetical protein n=1 Tax=Shewanella sp. GutCb TaxID=2058315 RepID=UPI000C7B7C57|nr:hypothetical protein [Shewanella sp. GutCb]PKG73994.1 hypothetical protein CXF86_14990 [Shewanella sp. GutCb]
MVEAILFIDAVAPLASRNTLVAVVVVGDEEGGILTATLCQWGIVAAEYIGCDYCSCCALAGIYGEYSATL